jgi:hypothetical protein
MPKVASSKEVTLDLIAAADRRNRNTELELRLHVAQARKAGIWWEEIGAALGVTEQAAQQRFGRNAIGD